MGEEIFLALDRLTNIFAEQYYCSVKFEIKDMDLIVRILGRKLSTSYTIPLQNKNLNISEYIRQLEKMYQDECINYIIKENKGE